MRQNKYRLRIHILATDACIHTDTVGLRPLPILNNMCVYTYECMYVLLILNNMFAYLRHDSTRVVKRSQGVDLCADALHFGSNSLCVVLCASRLSTQHVCIKVVNTAFSARLPTYTHTHTWRRMPAHVLNILYGFCGMRTVQYAYKHACVRVMRGCAYA
jgi:hypothetical protein